MIKGKNIWIIIAAALLALTGCGEKDLATETNNPTFIAYMENSGTKTGIDGVKVYWEDGDEISVNGIVFVAKVDENHPGKAVFSKKNDGDKLPDAPVYDAYYPASVYNGNASRAVILPSLQVMNAEDGFSKNNIMYACSSTSYLFFRNICALLKLHITGTDMIKAIKVVDRKKDVRGAFHLNGYAMEEWLPSTPGIMGKDQVHSQSDLNEVPGITLDFGEAGMKLNENGSTFYIAIPPAEYEFLSIKLIHIDGREYVMNVKETVSVERNSLYPIEIAPEFKDSDLPPYLCFTTEENGSTIYNSASNLFFSYDGINWRVQDHSNALVLAKYDKVYFRGSQEESATGRFFMTGKISAAGNIMSLIDSTCQQKTIPSGRSFGGLFYNCTSLETAPELPATVLTESCYSSMFYGCTSLKEAPALPATTLSRNCYSSMFYGCTSLKEAPALPATTLSKNCYSSMFYGCTSLETAPDLLPATTLTESCYSSMFYNCTSLKEAPALPAESLAEGCYKNMFTYCTSIETAPDLPATTLFYECYYQMFYGCHKLNRIKVGFSLWPSVGYNNPYTGSWLFQVASRGTFICPNTLLYEKRSSDFIPEGWTIERY